MSDASPLESIFFAALEKQPGADRCAYLDDACAVDDGLRRRVEGMLAAEGEAGNFLQCPPPPPGATSEWPLTEHPGSQIGAYAPTTAASSVIPSWGTMRRRLHSTPYWK